MVKRIKRVRAEHHSHLSPLVFVSGLLAFALAGLILAFLLPSPTITGASLLDIGSTASAWVCADGVGVRVSDTSGVCRSPDDWGKVASSFCTVSGPMTFSQSCIIKASCTDSDGGVQYYIFGTALGYDATQSSSQLTNVSDHCIDAVHLREWTCDSSASDGTSVPVLHFADYGCPDGCLNGACVLPPQALTLSKLAFFRKAEDVNSTTFPSTSRSDATGSYWLLSNSALYNYVLYLGILGNDAPISSHYTVTLVPVRDPHVSYIIAAGDAEIELSNPYAIYNLKVPISGLNSGPIPQTTTLEGYTLYLNISTNEAKPRGIFTTQRVVLSR